MIKIKMLKDTEYSLDGRTITSFAKGEVYEVPQQAFDQFYADGAAQKINPTHAPAPENKAVEEVKEVKRGRKKV